MVLTVIIYLLFQYVQALPISKIDEREESIHDISDSRTIWDIIWSCLSVIFLCTWVSYHPDLPKPWKRKFGTYVQHGMKLGLALIAPEVVTAFALDDFVAAHKLAREYKGYEWTLTHGFFAEMGGFVLYDGDKPSRTLDSFELEPYLKSGEICVTAEEIQDKSKGDSLAKTLVLFQTAWFILQLIARGVQKLPITELEVVTLSYAILNFLVYAVWWHKPLNVDCPILVYRGMRMPRSAIDGGSSRFPKESAPGYSGEGEGHVSLIAKNGAVDLDHTESPADNSCIPEVDVERDKREHENNRAQSNENIVGPNPADIEKDSKLAKFVDVVLDFLNDKEHPMGLVASGAIFGAIHFIPWFDHFSTFAEKIMWRTCSVFITSAPLIMLIISVVVIMANLSDDMLGKISKTLIIMVGILYVLARFILLGPAFGALRSLPPGALATVRWTTFIPHI